MLLTTQRTAICFIKDLQRSDVKKVRGIGWQCIGGLRTCRSS
jgi:hypothetical protein